MSISIDGTSLVWDGEVHITNFTDPDTGVVTLTLTPAGGIGSLPALVDGTPGVPSPPRNVTVNEVAAGTTLPAPVVTIVDPGGAGTAAIWDLTFSVHAGA